MLPTELLQPANLSNMINNESILLGVIVCIVARYRHLIDGTDAAAAVM